MSEENNYRLENDQKADLQVGQHFRLQRTNGSRKIIIADVDLTVQSSGKPLILIPSREEHDLYLKKTLAREAEKADDLDVQGRISHKREGDLEQTKHKTLNIQDMPHPKSKLCAICKVKFTNYYQHILDPKHKQNFILDPRNAMLQNFLSTQKIKSTSIFQAKKQAQDRSPNFLTRRPDFEEYRREEKDEFLGIPQKRKKTLRENGNNASSTNIFQFSLSENPANIEDS